MSDHIQFNVDMINYPCHRMSVKLISVGKEAKPPRCVYGVRSYLAQGWI